MLKKIKREREEWMSPRKLRVFSIVGLTLNTLAGIAIYLVISGHIGKNNANLDMALIMGPTLFVLGYGYLLALPLFPLFADTYNWKDRRKRGVSILGCLAASSFAPIILILTIFLWAKFLLF